MLRRTTLALLLAFSLIAAACATGGTPQAEGPSAAALTPTSIASSAASEQLDDGTTSEGIEVRGSWMIEVRNPDGSLDERVEFENALTQLGRETIALALAGQDVDFGSPFGAIRPYVIGVYLGETGGLDFDGTSPCLLDYGVVGLIPLSNPTPNLDTVCGFLEDDMTIEVGGAPLYAVLLSGSFIAERNGRIDRVETISSVATVLTGTNITPIEVQANQTVYVEVEISFS